VVALYVVTLLGNGTMRFNEPHRAIEGITQLMLIVTMRTLQRD
jgi:DNA-binding HxlR family transcriptional regulator